MKRISLALQAMLGTSLLLGCATAPAPMVDIKPVMDVKHGGVQAAEGYYQLGRHYQSNGRFADAERAFRRAVALDDQMAEAYGALGTLYAGNRSFALAMPELEKAIALEPAIARFRSNLGYAYYLQGRSAEAIQAYESALALDPHSARTWNNLGLALAQAGNVQRAEAAYARGTAIEAGALVARAPATPPRVAVTPPATQARALVDAASSPEAVTSVPVLGPAFPSAAENPAAMASAPSPDTPMLVPIAEIANPATSMAATSLLIPVVSPLTPLALLSVSELAEAFRQPVAAEASEAPLELVVAGSEAIERFVPLAGDEAVPAAPVMMLDEWKVTESPASVQAVRGEPTSSSGALAPAEPRSQEAVAMFEPLPTLDAALSGTLVPPTFPTIALVEPVVASTATDGAPAALLPALDVPSQPARVLADPVERLGTLIVEMPESVQVVTVAPNAFELKYVGSAVVARADNASSVNVTQRTRYEISNGNGVTGMARRTDGLLRAVGLPKSRLTNQKPFAQRRTEIQYRSGHEDEAASLAMRIPGRPEIVRNDRIRPGVDVRLVLGQDLPRNLALVDPAGELRRADVSSTRR